MLGERKLDLDAESAKNTGLAAKLSAHQEIIKSLDATPAEKAASQKAIQYLTGMPDPRNAKFDKPDIKIKHQSNLNVTTHGT